MEPGPVREKRTTRLARTPLHPLLLLAILTLNASFVAAEERSPEQRISQAPTVTVKGDVVKLACEITRGHRETIFKECAISCNAPDNALGIFAEDGTFYVTLDAQGSGLLNRLRERLNGIATMSGVAGKRRGNTQVLSLTSVR